MSNGGLLLPEGEARQKMSDKERAAAKAISRRRLQQVAQDAMIAAIPPLVGKMVERDFKFVINDRKADLIAATALKIGNAVLHKLITPAKEDA